MSDTTLTLNLTFARLRRANVQRYRTTWPDARWGPTDWLIALVGEVGELAHLMRSQREKMAGAATLAENSYDPSYRQDSPPEDLAEKQAIADELADVVCFLDQLAWSLGVDLGEAVRAK